MWSWLKSLFVRAKRIDPPVFGPFPPLEALEKAEAAGTPYHTSGTASMVPLIPARMTMLAVRKRALDDSMIGRVAMVLVPADANGSRAHRITARFPSGGYVLRGDNNPVADSDVVVTADNFVGEVAGIYLVEKAPS